MSSMIDGDNQRLKHSHAITITIIIIVHSYNKDDRFQYSDKFGDSCNHINGY